MDKTEKPGFSPSEQAGRCFWGRLEREKVPYHQPKNLVPNPSWFLLTGILLLAAFFRLHRMPRLPWGLSQDEVGNASISLGVLADGGAPFLAGGFGHEPLFHYLQAATLTSFGDNVVGIRMPAVMAGMVLVAASYTLMRQLFGPVAALVAAAGLAVSWWPVIFSRIGIRAITFPLLLTLAVTLLWRGLALRRRALVLFSGLLFGLTFYTYTSAYILPALVLAWLAYAAVFQRSKLRRHWRALAGAGLVMAVVAVPLAFYLHAHPELQERVRQLEGPLVALRQGDPVPLGHTTWATLTMFSRSGEARWTYGIPGRPILGPLSGLLLYLGLVRCAVQARRSACGLIGLWLLVTLVPSMITPDAPSSIRAIGALPAAYGMVGVGAAWLWEWAARRGRPVRTVLLVLLAGGLSLAGVIHLTWTYRDGFGTWPAHYEVYWRYKAHFADIAAFLDEQPSPQPAVVVEEWVDTVDVDGLRRDLVQDGRQPRWAQAGRSFIWPAGADRFTLAVPIFSAVDPDIWRTFAGDPAVVSASPYKMADDRPGVTFYGIETEPHRSDFLAQAALSPVTLAEGTQPVRLPADFGGQIALLGYQVLNAAKPGGELRLVTIWRILRDEPEPLSIFVHLLDEDGNAIAQHDGFDAWTASLRRGDIVAQLHPILLEADLPHAVDGEARKVPVQMGVYTRADLQRLPVMVNGAEVADRLWLATVEMTR